MQIHKKSTYPEYVECEHLEESNSKHRKWDVAPGACLPYHALPRIHNNVKQAQQRTQYILPVGASLANFIIYTVCYTPGLLCCNKVQFIQRTEYRLENTDIIV